MDPSLNQAYFSEFGEILIFIIGGVLFVAISLFVSKLIRPRNSNPEKLATYESGEEPISTPWGQFNVRFYIIALIFILFEIELVFLFPWATVFANKELIERTNGAWGWFSLIEMVIFILVLAVGLAFAWVNGFLDWIKSQPKIPEFKSPVPKDLYNKINERYTKSS